VNTPRALAPPCRESDVAVVRSAQVETTSPRFAHAQSDVGGITNRWSRPAGAGTMARVGAAQPSQDWVALLDADRSLASALAPETLAAALPACLATAHWFGPGPWHPSEDLGGTGCLGLLVLDGFVVRHVDVIGRPATELLGAGDLLRPWDPDRTTPFSSGARWHALEPCRVAVLDERVCAVIGRWPDLVATLVGRALARSREQAIGLAVGQVRSMQMRLLVVLTHELLANLTSAQRPSVTHGLAALRRRGLIDRTSDGRLVLRGDPPSALARLRESLS
jgi:CRP/FNR family cyclic AMP-dependent transcriptional regulator